VTPGTVTAPASTPSNTAPGGGARANRTGGADAFGAFLAGAADAHAAAPGRRETSTASRTVPAHPDQHGHTAGRKAATAVDETAEKPTDSTGGTPAAAPTQPALSADGTPPTPVDALAVLLATPGAAVAAPVDSSAMPVTPRAAATADGTAAGAAVPVAQTVTAPPSTTATAGELRSTAFPAPTPSAVATPSAAPAVTVEPDAGALPTAPALPVATAPAQMPPAAAPSSPVPSAPAATDPSAAPSNSSTTAAASAAEPESLPPAPTPRGTRAAQQEAPVAATSTPQTGAVEQAATSRPVVAAGPAVELQNRPGAPADALPSIAAAAPVTGGPAASATSAVAATAAPSSPQPQTLDAQLARPVFTLAAAGRGEHVMTVHVTPDNLGPVTVRAHVGVDGVRVELFAPNDAGRDALRAILPDLRRDLSSTGLTGTLDLSSQNQPSQQQQAAADGRAFGQQGDGRAAADGRNTGDGRSPSSRAEADRTADRLPLPAPDGAIHSIDLIV
jgi:flagellar hook-length control protein FliK